MSGLNNQDSSTTPPRVCFATLLTTDSYLHGALTLAASLRETGTQHEIICLVAEAQLSKPALERLSTLFDRIIHVPILDTKDYANLALLGRPDLGSTVTKISVWSLTEYSRVVFLDADTLVLQSIDHLLDSPDDSNDGYGILRPNGGMKNKGLLAAAPDLGWPDCFNSGVFVAEPSKQTHTGLLQLLAEQGSFDGGDQGLLNAYFDDWSRADHTRRLPFGYNATSTSFYTYAPAFAHFSSNIKVAHFIGPQKPWKWTRLTNGVLIDCPKGLETFIKEWWRIHDTRVSFWSPDVGLFDKSIALSLSATYKAEEMSEESINEPVALGSHAMDGSWRRDSEEGYAFVQDGREAGNDTWSTFTPASDFALTPTSPSSSSSREARD